VIGRQLSLRYDVVSLVAESPVFKVFSGRDKVTTKDVSIRTLNQPFASEPEFHHALNSCIQEMSGLKHPGLERLFEIGEDQGDVYLIGDPVRGTSLAERIKKLAPFSVPVAMSTAVTLSEAVAALHRAGITHGDIGSHNVTVLPEGTALVQLPNLWKSYGASRTAGAVVLPQMAAYLAPEISAGGQPTLASDVYAIGVILFELLVGRRPYQGDSPVATAMLHASQPTPSPRDLNGKIPVALDEVVKKALAKDPSQRYPSAVELLSDLRMIQDALRFGRNLSWPLRESDESAVQEPIQRVKQPEPIKYVELEEEEPYSADVPNWLKGVLVFFLTLAALTVGAFIIYNLQKPKLTTVPDLKGMSISEAEETLRPNKLKVRVIRRIASETFPQDAVIDTDPEANSKVYEGDTIGAVVSAGSRFVEVPDLRGRTLDEAKLLLDSIGLSLDSQYTEERDPDMKKGMILEHVPEARKRVERKTAIKVVVSSGSERPDRRPTSQQKYLYTIRIELSDITEAVLMRVDMTDARGTRTISEQERQPGELVELTVEGTGEEAIFLIYYDGELITQKTKRAGEGAEEAP
jgi:serine/threonine protein kinase